MSGCSAFKGYPERATDPSTDLDKLRPDIEASAITACLKSPTVECRNRIIAARLYAIDILFSEENLFKQTRSSGFAATVATLGLTSAAAVAGGTASQILSGAAAFVIGTREAFQKEVLAERTLIAIHTAMRGGRTQALVRLRVGLSQPLDVYPLALVSPISTSIIMLERFLVGITESVGADARREELRLQQQLTFQLDEPADKIRAFVSGDDPSCSSPDATKFAQIQSCWPGAGVPTDTFMLDFVFQDAFAGKLRDRDHPCRPGDFRAGG